jgi:DNA-binding IclR family transcriptional regulator
MKQRSTKARNGDSDAGGAATSGTQAVDRALAIVAAIGDARPEPGLAELSAALDLHKTTAFRLLGALERAGFVARDAERQVYRLGPTLIRLGAQARRAAGLHEAARPVLESLAAAVGETATLEVLVGAEVLILDEAHGHHLLGSSPEIGTRWPAHAASTGKVLLAAARHEDGAAAHAPRAPRLAARLARVAPNTITSHARLDRELDAVWARGWAVGDEEIEEDFVAVAAPIRNGEGRVVAAISVGGPKARLDRARIAQLAGLVRRAAATVSDRLGAPLHPRGTDPPPAAPARQASGHRTPRTPPGPRRPRPPSRGTP